MGLEGMKKRLILVGNKLIYRTGFLLEFCFRNGKQHSGITNCQSTDSRKIASYFNASLAAIINLAKAACKRKE